MQTLEIFNMVHIGKAVRYFPSFELDLNADTYLMKL